MLHPQVRAFLDFLASSGAPLLHQMSVREAREFARARRSLSQPMPPAVASVEDLAAPGPLGPIPLRSYRPYGAAATAVLPVLVFFHGGGWVIGDLDTHDTLCRQLANFSGCAVIAVDYRMGPENRFPAAVDDAIAATRWVSAQGAALRIDPTRLAVGGDSAGGNLAAVVSIDARDNAGPAIAFQLLVYPATDLTRSLPSHVENGEGYFLTRATMDYFIGNYIADPKQYTDWRASPLLHQDLSRLPPALVITAGFDPLRDEGAAYAKRMTAAGNRAAYVCFTRQIHGFIGNGRIFDEANTAVALAAAELRRALGRAE